MSNVFPFSLRTFTNIRSFLTCWLNFEPKPSSKLHTLKCIIKFLKQLVHASWTAIYNNFTQVYVVNIIGTVEIFSWRILGSFCFVQAVPSHTLKFLYIKSRRTVSCDNSTLGWHSWVGALQAFWNFTMRASFSSTYPQLP